MADTLRVLLIAARYGAANETAQRRDRSRELLAISAVGGRVKHDSGQRLILVELPEGAEAKLAGMLPDAQFAAPEGDLKAVSANLDASEALFLEAIRIRHSAAFVERKAKRQFGESPEEQLLSTGSCIRGY